MGRTISKSNASETLLALRLDAIQMSAHERLLAKASLARAEAFAAFLVQLVNGVKNLARKASLRPYHRPNAPV
jgi:hypothetical protein